MTTLNAVNSDSTSRYNSPLPVAFDLPATELAPATNTRMASGVVAARVPSVSGGSLANALFDLDPNDNSNQARDARAGATQALANSPLAQRNGAIDNLGTGGRSDPAFVLRNSYQDGWDFLQATQTAAANSPQRFAQPAKVLALLKAHGIDTTSTEFMRGFAAATADAKSKEPPGILTFMSNLSTLLGLAGGLRGGATAVRNATRATRGTVPVTRPVTRPVTPAVPRPVATTPVRTLTPARPTAPANNIVPFVRYRGLETQVGGGGRSPGGTGVATLLQNKVQNARTLMTSSEAAVQTLNQIYKNPANAGSVMKLDGTTVLTISPQNPSQARISSVVNGQWHSVLVQLQLGADKRMRLTPADAVVKPVVKPTVQPATAPSSSAAPRVKPVVQTRKKAPVQRPQKAVTPVRVPTDVVRDVATKALRDSRAQDTRRSTDGVKTPTNKPVDRPTKKRTPQVVNKPINKPATQPATQPAPTAWVEPPFLDWPTPVTAPKVPVVPKTPKKPPSPVPGPKLSPEGQEAFDKAAAKSLEQVLQQREADYRAGRSTREDALAGLQGDDRTRMDERLNKADATRGVQDVGGGRSGGGAATVAEVKSLMDSVQSQGGLSRAPEFLVRRLTGFVESALRQPGLSAAELTYLNAQLKALQQEQTHIHKGRAVLATLREGKAAGMGNVKLAVVLAQSLADTRSVGEFKRINRAVASDAGLADLRQSEAVKTVNRVQPRELQDAGVADGSRVSHAQAQVRWYRALAGLQGQPAATLRGHNEAIRAAGLTPVGVVRFIEIVYGRAAIEDPARLSSLLRPALATITRSNVEREADKAAGVADPLAQVDSQILLQIYELFPEGAKTVRPQTWTQSLTRAWLETNAIEDPSRRVSTPEMDAYYKNRDLPAFSYSTYSARDVVIASAYFTDERLSSVAKDLASFTNGSLNAAYGPSRYKVAAPTAQTRAEADKIQRAADAAPALADHSDKAKATWVQRATDYAEQANPAQRARLTDAVRNINAKLASVRDQFPQLGRTEPMLSMADLVRFFYAEKKRDFSGYAKVEDFVKYAESFAGAAMAVPGRKAWIKTHLNPTPVTNGAAKVRLMEQASVNGQTLPMTRSECLAMEKTISRNVKGIEDKARGMGTYAAEEDLQFNEVNRLYPLQERATSPAQQVTYRQLGVTLQKMRDSIEQYRAQLASALQMKDSTTEIAELDRLYGAEMAAIRAELQTYTDPLFADVLRNADNLARKSMLDLGVPAWARSLTTDKQQAEYWGYTTGDARVLTALRERLRLTEPDAP